MFNSLLRRRLAVLISSGALIIVGWIARWFALPTPSSAQWLFGTAMIAAAVIAGSGIARRAVQELLARRLGIEVLVTIAVTGALIIGEYWEAAAVTFLFVLGAALEAATLDRKSTRLNSSHVAISYAVFCLKKQTTQPAGGRVQRQRHAVE